MTAFSTHIASSDKTDVLRPPDVSGDRLLLVRTRITDRQLECLSWVQEGKSASDIGVILGLSARTVEKHLLKLCGHLGVKTRVQAVVLSRELGLLGPPREREDARRTSRHTDSFDRARKFVTRD